MKYLFFILILLSNDVFSQSINDNSAYEHIITDINNYELENATDKIKKLNNEEVRILFQNEVSYLKTGLVSQTILSLDTSKFNYYVKGLYFAFLGDYYSRVSNKFTKKSFELYLKAYQLGVKYQNISLQQESLRRILYQFQWNEMNFIQFSEYSDKYSKLENDFINTFWARYFSVFKKYYEKTEFNKNNGFTVKSYDSLLVYSREKPMLKGRVYQMMAIYYDVVQEYNRAKICLENAKLEYKKSNYFFSQLPLHKIEFNEGYHFLDLNEPLRAIAIFKKSEQYSYFKKDVKSSILISDALYKAYSKIKNKDSALYYFNRRTAFEDTLKREENTIAIHEIDTKYQIREKNHTISSQNEDLKNNKKYRFLYFIIAIAAFLMALYSFVRWKKVDIRRKKLAKEKESIEIERSQIIEELEKVKQMVIEDHIVLKNKTKIYLNELIYIKAEDHYLKLFTLRKNEFVRGKISEIIQELPPNFVQAHRSYIVNKNFIISQNGNLIFLEGKIEVPLSRNFKNNFKKNFL